MLFKSYMHALKRSLKNKTYNSVLKDDLSVVDIKKCTPYIWGMKGLHYTDRDTMSKLADIQLTDKHLATVEAGHEQTYVVSEYGLAADDVYYREWLNEEILNECLHTRE